MKLIVLLLLQSRLIVTSIPPLASIVIELMGGKYEVISLLNQYQNPHTYELKPSDIKKVADADLYIEVGGHIESWGRRLTGVNKNTLRILDTLVGRGIKVGNPHIWLDLNLLPVISEVLLENLIKKFPEDSLIFKENNSRFVERVDSLKDFLIEDFKDYRTVKVLVHHPSWNPFFKLVGIEVVGSLSHHGEKELSPGEFGRWIDRIKKDRIALIVGEVTIPSKVPERLARDAGICFVSVNPLFNGNFIEGFSSQVKLIKGELKCRK